MVVRGGGGEAASSLASLDAWIGRERPPLSQDHAKWGVSINTSSSTSLVCIGDMNRMSSQWALGGGSICFTQPNIYTPFLGSVVKADSC